MARILTNSQGKVIIASDNAFEVTAAVDPNITAGNIKEGVEILGVTGTFAQNAEAEENDVIFIDYDGTIRYSYSAQDFLALTEMPANPTHPGLVSQGWNWTLAEAKTYVSANGILVVGQHYVTDDGKTRLYIIVGTELREYIFYWYQSDADGVTIDWGDGTTPETYGTAGAATLTHTYATGGSYVISMNCTSGTYRIGDGGVNKSCFGVANDNSTQYMRESLLRVELGTDCGISGAGLRDCRSLKTITTYNTFYSLNGQAFYNDTSLVAFVLGRNDSLGTPSIGSMAFSSCPLRYLSLPGSLSGLCSLGGSKIEKLSLSGPLTTFENNGLQIEYLKKLVLPSTLQTIAAGSLAYIRVQTLVIPASVTSFGNMAMYSAPNLRKLYMMPTTPPSLYSSNYAIPDGDYYTIYVPYSADHSILTAYQGATNWSVHASQMVEMPE